MVRGGWPPSCRGTPALLLRRLLDPKTADLAARALGPRGRQLSRVIRNTVSPTIVHGGDKINVIPSDIELQLDGRILPGQTPDDLIASCTTLVGNDVEFEVDPSRSGAARSRPLASTSRSRRSSASSHPGSVPVPMLQAGVTDARFLSRAGLQTYGYLPLKLPEDFEPFPLIHNADERVPADALAFGVEAITQRDRPLPRMRLLVLGGTKFLGRHAVDAALAAGHEVTIFTRGQTNPELFPDGRASDAATATAPSTRFAAARGTASSTRAATCRASCASRRSCCAIRSAATSSSPASPCTATSAQPVTEIDRRSQSSTDPSSEEVMEDYGALKAACERVVEETYGDRSARVRAGLIVGPYDPTDRFTYWPRRIARGGDGARPRATRTHRSSSSMHATSVHGSSSSHSKVPAARSTRPARRSR